MVNVTKTAAWLFGSKEEEGFTDFKDVFTLSEFAQVVENLTDTFAYDLSNKITLSKEQIVEENMLEFHANEEEVEQLFEIYLDKLSNEQLNLLLKKNQEEIMNTNNKLQETVALIK